MYNIIKLPELSVIVLTKELKDSIRPIPVYEIIDVKAWDPKTKHIYVDSELKDMLIHKQIFVISTCIKFKSKFKFFAKRKFKKVKPEEVEKEK